MSDDNDRQGPRCTGRRADGRPCRNYPIEGTTRCFHHSFRVPGRPTKLTPELRDAIVLAVVEGNYLSTAAQLVGVSERLLHRWLAKGDDVEAAALEHVDEADEDTYDLYQHTDPVDWVYLDFRHSLESARAWAESEFLRMAARGGMGWQAQMTVLERRHPTRWRRRESRDVEVSGDVRSRVEVVAPDTDTKRQEVAAVLAGTGVLDGVKPKATPKRKRAAK